MTSARKIIALASLALTDPLMIGPILIGHAFATPSTALLRAYHEKLKAMDLPPGFEDIIQDPKNIGQITLAPLFDRPFVCGEHPQGQLMTAGDALGTDCMVVGGGPRMPEGITGSTKARGRKTRIGMHGRPPSMRPSMPW